MEHQHCRSNAKADWRKGRIILPPNDNKEFIPLPGNLGPAASPAPEPLSLEKIIYY